MIELEVSSKRQIDQTHDDSRVRKYGLVKRLSANTCEKFCRGCSLTKSHSEFYKSKSHWDGVRHQCKDCVREKQNKYRIQPEIKEKISNSRKESSRKARVNPIQTNTIKRIAVVATQFTEQAGGNAVTIAGRLISVLAENPQYIDKVISGEMSVADLYAAGCFKPEEG